MKILFLSTYDSDGGAAKACFRILRELSRNNIFGSMLVRTKRTDSIYVQKMEEKFRPFLDFLMPYIDRLPLKKYKNANVHFWNVGWLPNPGLIKKINTINPDIVQLHWISEGFIPIKAIEKINRPIIWRLSDSWAFTGGCHVPFDCTNYINGCGNCPQLNSGKENDLTRKTFNKKQKNWKNLNLTIVTPSNWMADCVKSSALFKNRKVVVIYPGVDTNIFRPRDKVLVKKEINLQIDKRYIVFGAIKATEDINKGFHLLQKALLILKQKLNDISNIEILILGASKPEKPLDLGFKINYVGRINDEITLALYYSVAEVFVLPSLKDNSPNTVIESLACGIPVVAFGACGALDMIDHKSNGYLADAYSVDDLSNGIKWILDRKDSARYVQLSESARLKVLNEFNIEKKAIQYVKLYNQILN